MLLGHAGLTAGLCWAPTICMIRDITWPAESKTACAHADFSTYIIDRICMLTNAAGTCRRPCDTLCRANHTTVFRPTGESDTKRFLATP